MFCECSVQMSSRFGRALFTGFYGKSFLIKILFFLVMQTKDMEKVDLGESHNPKYVALIYDVESIGIYIRSFISYEFFAFLDRLPSLCFTVNRISR